MANFERRVNWPTHNHSNFDIRHLKLVSVAGLAPARLCLKDRPRELLCIDGGAGARPLGGTRPAKLVPEVGIAPTSPALQAGANLPQLLRVKWKEALRFRSASSFVQSRNATFAIVRLCVSVFMMTRCQHGSVMTSWSL